MKNWILTHKLLTIILACAIGVGAVCAVTIPIVVGNRHEFSSEWKHDETSHWHECTTKKHTDTTEKTPHVFTWTEKTPAGVHTDKVEKGVCECGYETERTISGTATHTYGAEWKKDASGHWHESICGATAPTHEVMKKDFAEHTFGDGVETKPADYGVAGEKKFTCTKCGYEKTETINALGAKDNEIKLAEGKTLGKEYDGEVVSITKADFVIEGNRTPTIMFKAKGADDNTYTATAPKKAGEYIVKVSVEGTAEWKAATKTLDFVITPMVIGVDWEHSYNNSNIITGEPAELLYGDEAMITVTMESANVGAAVQSFEITGKDAGNYSLAREDVNVAIVKADIEGFEISNAAAFEKGFYVGATNIPDPTTDYDEIGTGYGERTIVWEKQLEGGVWSRNLTKDEVMQSKTGTFQVRIKYAEGDNYNFGATPSVSFTLNVKPRTLNVMNFDGKTYDGTPVANFNYDALEDTVEITDIPGVNDLTSPYDGEQYAEYRKKGEAIYTKVTGTYIPKNAAEYEYRIGIKATDEWEAVVSEIKTFTIKPYEFVLELGYVENQNNRSSDGGKTFKLRTFSKANGKELIEGQVIELWLDNEKARLDTEEGNNGYYHFIPDQKKQVRTGCFFLKIANLVSANMENYKIVPKYSNVTTVEMTVVVRLTTEKSTTGKIQLFNETEKWIGATVEKGYFMVGQTVEIYNSAGTKLGEATITEIKVKGTTSASGCAIPSDGQVVITLDKVFSGMTYGKLVAK